MLVAATNVHAFCVYNNSKKGIVQVAVAPPTAPVEQVSKSGAQTALETVFPWIKTQQHPTFHAELGPGQSACCGNDEAKCNYNPKNPEAVLYLAYTYREPMINGQWHTSATKGIAFHCLPTSETRSVPINANGYAVIDNTSLFNWHVARVHTYHANHTLRQNTWCPGSYNPFGEKYTPYGEPVSKIEQELGPGSAVLGAWYGSEAHQTVGGMPVAYRILFNIQKGAIVVPANMNQFFGADPMPNVPKQVAVHIRYQGRDYHIRQSEGKELRFPGRPGIDYQ